MDRTIPNLLKPLSECPLQTYLGCGIHTLGLLGWILRQVGRSDVYVSTFSTSEEFLTGFLNLKRKGLVGHSVLLADLKASKKTVRLKHLMSYCFDSVYLGQNHSKVVLVKSETGQSVSVITSQNQTYGGRAECTMLSTSEHVFRDLYRGFSNLVNEDCILLNGFFPRELEPDRGAGPATDTGFRDFRPFGAPD